MITLLTDLKAVASSALPWFLRTEVFTALSDIMGTELNKTNNNLVIRGGAIRSRLPYTGQVVSLEAYLNNVFDSGPRRIFIEDIATPSGLFLRRKTEAVPFQLYLRRKSEPGVQLYLRRKSEPGVGFIVHVPDDLGAEITESRVRVEVDRLRAFGTSYSVIFEAL